MPPQSGYVSNFRSPNSAVIEPWTRIVFKMIGGDCQVRPAWPPRLDMSRTRQGPVISGCAVIRPQAARIAVPIPGWSLPPAGIIWWCPVVHNSCSCALRTKRQMMILAHREAYLPASFLTGSASPRPPCAPAKTERTFLAVRAEGVVARPCSYTSGRRKWRRSEGFRKGCFSRLPVSREDMF